MVAPKIHVPAAAGYLGAVALLVIGVAVGFSEKSTDSDSTTANKRLTSTVFILTSVILAVITYFLNQEGGLINNWFGKSSSTDSVPVPGVTCDANSA
jgi:uncharacterized membrane protein